MTNDYGEDSVVNKLEAFIARRLPEFTLKEHSNTSFSRLGLDSADHVQLTAIIEDHFGINIEPTLAFDYPTVNSIVSHLENLTTEKSL